MCLRKTCIICTKSPTLLSDQGDTFIHFYSIDLADMYYQNTQLYAIQPRIEIKRKIIYSIY